MPSKQADRAAPPETEDAPGRSRAAALPASERRAEIIAATLPLVLAHGSTVTTRQIAEAAGIAEGTIFRVFPDKENLFQAVFEAAFDTSTLDTELAAIDEQLPLEGRLIAAVNILRRRVAEILQLRTALGMMPTATAPAPKGPQSKDLRALAKVFERDADQLRRTPLEAAHLLRGLTIAGTHPALLLDKPLTADEIVSLLLDGVRCTPTKTSPRGGRRC